MSCDALRTFWARPFVGLGLLLLGACASTDVDKAAPGTASGTSAGQVAETGAGANGAGNGTVGQGSLEQL